MTIPEINADLLKLKKLLRQNGFPVNLIQAIETRSLRSGRRMTGIFRSNRHSRWALIFNDPIHGTDPQYGTEIDCKVILMTLLLTTLEFIGAPKIEDTFLQELAQKYMGRILVPDSFKDSLLLEHLDFAKLRLEADDPTHGKSEFHIGHLDPKRVPKHVPENVAWRTLRSNLIQGDMTLKQARTYIIKLIARYFELGELNIED